LIEDRPARQKMRSLPSRQVLELDFRLIRPGAPGEEFEALVRDLGKMLGMEVEWSGRGADEGRDLIFVEQLSGRLSVERVRWLVQCKDHSAGGKSVRESEVGAIIDRIHQHRANGFLLATTTTPSTGLKKRLDALDMRNGGPIRTWVWDAAELRRLLRMDEARPIAATYFPYPDLQRLRHDMLSSLSTLSNNCECLLESLDRPADTDSPATQRQMLATCIALIDDLRFQVEGAGLRPGDPEWEKPVRLDRNFLDRIVRRARHFAVVHGSLPIRFEFSLNSAGESRPIRVSDRILERVILEIVSNAIRYRKSGEQPRIRIARRDERDRILIVIEDRGIGIDPAESGHIFQPGYRGPAAQRLSLRASGLGLSAARALIRSFGGDIQFDADAASTRFLIILQPAEPKP
jgi:signal transduction histidine kinase